MKNLEIIKNHWMLNSEITAVNKRNFLLRSLSKYFLKKKMNRYILLGRMKNKEYYLKTVR